jgi:site-specific recombinase XerD
MTTKKRAPKKHEQKARAKLAALTMEEFKRMLSDEKITSRQRLMFKVGFWHGLRVSELVPNERDGHPGLRREDIAGGYLRSNRLKGSLSTVQAFQSHPDPLLDESKELHELYRELKPGEACFPMTRDGVRKLMQRIAKRTGIPEHKMHPHALKHTIAKLTIKAAGIEHVRQHLGHKSIASTGQYLKVSDEEATRAISAALR